MHVINGIYGQGLPTPTHRAAMYYKTEPLVSGIKYHHTNNWEIVRAIQILNSKGFVVDLIDRTNGDWSPTHKYDLFLGLGVGNSGRRFAEYARRSGASKKILLAMGPQPDVSNERVLARYDAFRERTGVAAPPMRTVTDVMGDSFLRIIENTDYIFNIGEEGTESYNSFLKYEKPVFNFYPAISPNVSFENSWLTTRDRNSFLCFAGNGLICKGVDVVVEAFLKHPDMNLHICGPIEKSFFDYYGQKIEESKNITYHGFIDPGGSKFNELASICSFVVFNSSAEGCCTSVATAMKAGLVPIINSWTGIKIEECGISIHESNDNISSTISAINLGAALKESEYNLFVNKTLEKSKLFSQESFTESYHKAISRVLDES